MGDVSETESVLLFAGFISQQGSVREEVKSSLVGLWGPILAETPWWPFSYTSYYEKEMGAGLERSFALFDRKIDPSDLPVFKIESNEAEARLSREGQRRVNIDPGYLTLAKVVLASTKNYSHRLYLGKGIYGEITLRFARGSFHPLEWTYPDYRDERTILFFNDSRKYLTHNGR